MTMKQIDVRKSKRKKLNHDDYEASESILNDDDVCLS